MIGYYEDVREAVGGQADVDEFLRLFMIPGAGHCWEAPHVGPQDFDQINALERWVEHGIAPDRIPTRQADGSGKTVRLRPLCAYPRVAQYKGAGSIDDAKNFRCAIVSE